MSRTSNIHLRLSKLTNGINRKSGLTQSAISTAECQRRLATGYDCHSGVPPLMIYSLSPAEVYFSLKPQFCLTETRKRHACGGSQSSPSSSLRLQLQAVRLYLIESFGTHHPSLEAYEYDSIPYKTETLGTLVWVTMKDGSHLRVCYLPAAFVR